MVGRTISHYRIVSQLGSGGMGVVYRAEDVRLGREVAIKFVSDDYAHDSQAVSRLRSEARAASALSHANICTIYDVGEDNGHPFIVMELMKGTTLRERLQSGPLKVHHLVDIGIEIADALHATHTDGIIHRDIKPGNIFLTERGHVKVLDFGLAKLTPHFTGSSTTNEGVEQTVAGVTLGTIAYMSPEQATGEELDGRTDLFSLGVVLYECATGRHPFPGKTSALILSAILNKAPVAPITLNTELPVRLQEVINNCLEKDRELRYQSAADLRADLKRLRRDIESGHSRPMEVASGAARSGSGGQDVSAVGSGSASLPAPAPAGMAPWIRAVLAVVGIGAIAGGVSLFWPERPQQAPTEEGRQAGLSDSAIDSRISLAQSSLDARNYRAAQAYAAEVLAARPDHPDAVRIRDEASSMLARFDAAIAEARRQLEAGNIAAAAAALETARDLDPSAPSLVDLGSQLSELARSQDMAARERANRQAEQRPAPRPPAAAGRERPENRPAPKPTPPVTRTPEPSPSPATPLPQPPAPAPPPVQQTPPPIQQTPPAVTPTPPPAQPTAEPRAPERPRPEPAPGETDDAAIRRVVSTYGRAIESKDINLFRSIKPNLSSDEERRLQEGFRAVTSQDVNLTIASLDRTGDTATVVVDRRDVIEAGGRRQTVQSRQTLSLRRTNGSWVITEIH